MIKEILEEIKTELEKRVGENYVGNISFQVNFGTSGITNMNIDTRKSWKPQTEKREGK